MRRWLPVVAAVAVVGACSLGDGVGSVEGELNLPDCWEGAFNLDPNFFAAEPYPETAYPDEPQSLTLRIQNGGDFETFSDGVEILIDSIEEVRGGGGYPGELGQPLTVSLPPGVTPPGVPVVATANPSIVHMTLYLQRTCHTQLDALYALDQVTLDANGGCSTSADAGTVPLAVQCGATGIAVAPDAGTTDGSAADASPLPDASFPDASFGTTDGGASGTTSGPVGTSSITFTHLFDGVIDESDAAQRLNQGSFDVYMADPREICPGGLGPPPPCRAHLTGTFEFYFERGRPAQPFP